MFLRSYILSALASTALAGTVLWDGRFNDMTSSEELTEWSWSNQVGPYQYYIHGSGNVTEYVNLDSSYKNPADTASEQGAKITIDSTATWNSDNMWRTELIPQTSAAINSGTVYYHFSMKKSSTNPPSVNHEHQVNFFESHFTEMKAGWISGEAGTEDQNLRWFVGGESKWNTTWEADVWHNVAYEIDFDGQTVTFWHSTGADPLTKTAGPFSASTSSNGADWHLGVLRLTRSGYDSTDPEDWYFSGVYVESGTITTSVSGPGGSSSSSSSASSDTASAVTTAQAVSSSTATSSLVSSSTPTTLVTKVVPVSSSSAAAATSATSIVAVSSAAPVAPTTTATSVAAPAPSDAADDEDDEDCE